MVPNANLWVLEAFLGKGGFGEVWRAKHRVTSEVRAVKFCTHAVAYDRLFTHESKIALHVRKHMSEAGGDHPNIVPLLDCNLDGDLPWLMYEYVPGGRTLEDVIAELASRPAAERIARTLQLMHVIAGAVGHFHRILVPIVHRDLKHKNVLMHDEQPRVADFGIGGAAVVAAISDATGGYTEITVRLPSLLRTSGTPPHASPQQLAGKDPDPRDDVYALGVMAYQLLVGRGDAKVQGYWHKRLQDDGVPEALIDLIGHSTSEELDDRPKDAVEWEVALAALQPTAGSVTLPQTPQKLRIDVWGTLYSRPSDNPEAEWRRVTDTPEEITIDPEQVYLITIDANTTDRRLVLLKGVAAFSALQSLSLSGCRQFTDAGLEHLKGLHSLQSLNLSYCYPVTDAGLEHLKGLYSLQSLNLCACDRVTDAGLEHLKGLRSLQSLNLSYCRKVTNAGVAALQKALPNCKITH